MFNIINLIFSFFSGDKKYFLIIATLGIFSGFLYLKLNSTSETLQKAKNDLNVTLQANQNLADNIEFLIQRHSTELKILSSINLENNALKENINETRQFIKNSNENNTTKLFNLMVNRLWSENSANK
ncbi:TPA: hypothetical protein RTG91_001398 [Campylobacter jejuni]|nr:hypothetical protein [Campylobacter jejuni]HDZ5046313.1 hypothetical protein [Campylobacter jejuni]HDZ5074473.1 hypothetical protein [Campylobacter jejuni]HDZ5094483.1 hypothetical protein [Campylobacter jejuni]HDZ5099394.1 hypothetical protein [Campylobacter jejuni]